MPAHSVTCPSRESAAASPPFRLRRLARYLPRSWQRVLRHLYYGWQIRTGRFASDEPEFGMLEQWVQPGDWVLDIGANIGHYTLKLASLVGPTGRVFAFEPVPETFELLTANVRRAGCLNVTLLNVAVSNESRIAGIDIPAGRTGLDGHYFAQLTDRVTARTVFCCPIDALGFPQAISLVKIDVEGHELAVLQGMQRLLRDTRPIVIVETNSDELTEYAKSLGLACRVIPQSHNVVLHSARAADFETAISAAGI